MKSALRNPSENTSIELKSDLIKSEIAKYRMLKSQGAIDTSEDIKENKLLSRATTLQSPSQQDSYRSALTLVHSNSPQTVTNTTNSLKGDYWPNSSKKGVSQPLQSFYSGPSLQSPGESFRGSTSHRDKSMMENYSNYYSTPVGKNNFNSVNMTNPRNSNSVRSPNVENNDKRMPVRKSLAAEERLKDKSLKQIDQFVDSDIEKEPTEKVYAKTAQHTFRNAQHPVTMVKSQNKGMSKASSTVEMRTSSTWETSSKNNTRETKNFTPEDEKRTQPESPKSAKSAIVRSFQNKKKGGVGVSQERKTESSVGRTVSPRRIMPVKGEGESENVMQEEIEKWRIFGKMMAESYDSLNKKYTDYMNEKEKDKKIINALKEQVSTLKNLLKESKEENLKISSKTTSASSGKEDNKDTMLLMKEIESIRVENKETNKTLEFLKVENEMLKSALEESQKHKELAEHFQKLADTRFKECSALAEEIICLRTDLDRSHSNYLRIQREQGSAKKGNDKLYSGRKLRQVGERESGWSFLAGNNSATTYKRWSERNAQDLSYEEDQAPTPIDLSTLPCKEENNFIRG